MAATGYTPISLYYSTTGSAVPLNTALVNGELAINITDGKLFYKDNGGTVQVIATKDAAAGTFTTVSVGDGSATTPSITNTGDTNTGIYFPAENQVGIATNGNLVALVDASGNVGIGTSSPGSRLNIAGSDGVAFTITQSGTTTGAADTGGTLVFQNYDGSNLRDGAYIYGRKENATVGNYASYMSFWTRANGVAAAERMRIDSSGNVGIGTTSPQVQLWRAGATLTVQGTTAGNIEVGSSRADGAGVAVGAVEWAWTAQDATHKHLALIEVDSEGATAGQRGGAMKFLTKPNGTATPAERMRITATGFTQPVAYADTVVALGNTGTATTITCTSGNVFTATLTGNCTFTLSAPIATGSSSFTLILTNDGTAGRTVAWSGGSFVFPGGAASLSRSTAANAVDVWVFFTPNGGTTWYGNIAMKDMKA